MFLAAFADGAEVQTIEYLDHDGTLDPVQEAFIEEGAFQCGFCTPGFMMTAVALVHEQRDLTDGELRDELSGNLCRCTGYQSIVEGVKLAMERARSEKP